MSEASKLVNLQWLSGACRESSPEGRMVASAKNFINSDLPFQWTATEKEIIDIVFTSSNGRIFFLRGLPSTLGGAFFTMCARLKNPRGLRGIFVDRFVPFLLAEASPPEEKIRISKTQKLDDLLTSSSVARAMYEEFKNSLSKSTFFKRVLASSNMQKFLAGERSTGLFMACFEGISLLAVSAMEQIRPGFGSEVPDSQLSGHYFDGSGKDWYPIAEELAVCGLETKQVDAFLKQSIDFHDHWCGNDFNGPFPKFLKETYGPFVGKEEDFDRCIIGESCDTLGNFLSPSLLTSVAIPLREEDLPHLLRGLFLNITPENLAIVDALRSEAGKLGYALDQQIDCSDWQRYADVNLRSRDFRDLISREDILISTEVVVRTLNDTFNPMGLSLWFNDLLKQNRSRKDNLPKQFEVVNCGFNRKLSFRGWYQLQRSALPIRWRSDLTPHLGSYNYWEDKPCPEDLQTDFEKIDKLTHALYKSMTDSGVPEILKQYCVPIGNFVWCQVWGSLRQWEETVSQATQHDVHHEVRKFALGCANTLTATWYPLFRKFFNRVDWTPAYMFAHSKHGIVLPDREKLI